MKILRKTLPILSAVLLFCILQQGCCTVRGNRWAVRSGEKGSDILFHDRGDGESVVRHRFECESHAGRE